MTNNSTERFSNRVEDYVKYRPTYPIEIVHYLQEQFGLLTDKVITDIGSGTGISSLLFLNAQYKVYAVEPNKEMRGKSVELLQHYPGFTAINGAAENTTLPDTSIDAIISGQAFHWFDAEKTATEFKRILKSDGIVVLMWNERETTTLFEKEYDELIIMHAKDYIKVDHRNISDKDINAFYFPNTCTLKIFDNYQDFDFDGLKGRLLSSSYMPTKNDHGYEAMIIDLKKLFEKYKRQNHIRINYATKVYAGKFK